MVKVNIFGEMDNVTKAIGFKIKCQEEEYCFGQMAENTKEIFILVTCMEEVYILGQMAESMKDNILMIKNMYVFLVKIIKGYGVYDWGDGRRYEGEWENGK